ncbi:hypothetical protein [Rhizobium metallidurans]|uniref:Uncharacterized protein n=1 Tax=Rhizobium metallidurans TaxID=1265931 RepID=A0A7W6D094_9HYPH|nr:hypothetical protein [Rhizobium metallidurans]MBB3966890.1 hypothetical protein [Rhizobium metallidurans]
MLNTPSKLVSLAAAVLIALPATAGDFGGNPSPRPHNRGYDRGMAQGVVGHGGGIGRRDIANGVASGSLVIRHRGTSVVGDYGGWGNGPRRIAGGYDGFRPKPGRGRFIQRFSSASSNVARNNIVIIDRRGEARAPSGTYAGSSYAYGADGGTYVGGYGYSGYGYQPATRLAPMAKVINIRNARNPCSYEQGVCVIRP